MCRMVAVRGFNFVDMFQDSCSILEVVHQRGVVHESSLQSPHYLPQPTHARIIIIIIIIIITSITPKQHSTHNSN